MEFQAATHPIAPRDHCRLLVLERGSGKTQVRKFFEILQFFRPGDCLVLNVSGVFPARILFERDGKEGELLLQRVPINGDSVLAKMRSRWAKRLAKSGGKVHFVKGGEGQIQILGFDESAGAYRVRVTSETPLNLLGEVPLPPYILRARSASGSPAVEEIDQESYQTVYAQAKGSLAAPTAGLHWTPELLEQVKAGGVSVAKIILDIGFASVIRAEGLAVLPEERYEISEEAARLINETGRKGGRRIACGTSVARTLESVVDSNREIHSGSGATSLFIKKDFQFRAVDALITNFHLLDSTHFMLTQSFIGSSVDLRSVYTQAAQEGFRFFSYGDAMLIL